MAAGIVRPNIDGATLDFVPDAGTVHFDRVNEVVTQPTAPSTASGYLSMGSGAAKVEILGMETIAGVSAVSQIKVWVYSSFTADGPTFTASIFVGGVFVADVSFAAAAAAGWYSATFSGSWTQADLDALQVRMTFSSGSPVGTLYAMYAEATYEEAASAPVADDQPPACVFRRR